MNHILQRLKGKFSPAFISKFRFFMKSILVFLTLYEIDINVSEGGGHINNPPTNETVNLLNFFLSQNIVNVYESWPRTRRNT